MKESFSFLLPRKETCVNINVKNPKQDLLLLLLLVVIEELGERE